MNRSTIYISRSVTRWEFQTSVACNLAIIGRNDAYWREIFWYFTTNQSLSMSVAFLFLCYVWVHLWTWVMPMFDTEMRPPCAHSRTYNPKFRAAVELYCAWPWSLCFIANGPDLHILIADSTFYICRKSNLASLALIQYSKVKVPPH